VLDAGSESNTTQNGGRCTFTFEKHVKVHEASWIKFKCLLSLCMVDAVTNEVVYIVKQLHVRSVKVRV